MDFLKNTLAATIGALVAFGIAFFMFFVFLAAIGSAEPDTKIEKESVLQLKLNQLVEEYLGADANDPFAAFVQDRVGFDQILKAVTIAKTDDRIEGISMCNARFMSRTELTKEMGQTQLPCRNWPPNTI